MGALHADVVAVLDQRSADRVVEQMERQFGDAGRGAGDSFNRVLGSQLVSGAGEVGRTAGGELRKGISGGIDNAVADFTRGFGTMGSVANSTFSAIKSGGGVAALGIAGVGVAAGLVVKQLYDMGSAWDAISDGITGRTGKMGDDLNGIVDVVKQVGSTAALSLEDIGKLAGGVSQSLHLTGTDLLKMTDQLASVQQVTGQVVNTRELGKSFRLFDIDDINAQKTALNQLLTVSQATDTPINELLGTMQQAGKTTKLVGLNFAETAGLLSTFDEAGLNAEQSTAGLSIALKNLAKDGQDPASGLADTVEKIKQLHDAGQEVAAINLASSTFGKGFSTFLPVIEDGELDIKKLHTALTNLGDDDSINKQKKATEDWAESFKKLQNTLTSDFGPAASAVFNGLNHLLEGSQIALLGKVLNAFNSPDQIKDPNAATNFDKSFGPGGGPNPLSILGINPPGSSAAAAPSMPGLNWQGPDAGFNFDFGAGGKKGPRLPDAPVVPLAGLPALAPGLREDASLMSAQNSVASANTDVAEKEARLNQLKASNTATEQDRLKADNDLQLAKRSANEAMLRFGEAQKTAFEAQNKQLKSLTDGLDQISAGLDADLGISKGLPGIADNLVRFLGSLALAGPMAQMAMTSAANPNQGFGLMGSLASTGAFGQQYTPAGIAAASGAYGGGYGGQTGQSAYGPSALQPSLTSAMSRLVGPGGSGTSPNGFPLMAPEQPFSVNGVSSQGAAGGPAGRLQQFAQWFNDNIEPVKELAGFDAGGHGLGNRSNHTSGTALDINWGDFTALQGNGADARTHFSPAQMQAISQQLAQSGMTWGQYWTPGSRDPGHFELGGASYDKGAQNVSPIGGQPPSLGAGWGGGASGGATPYAPMGGGQGGPFGAGPLSPTMPSLNGPGGIGAGIGAGADAGPNYGLGGQQQLGGVSPPGSAGGGGGIGITPGGSIDTALNLAAAAVPGLGAAAATGAKLASRAIQYGGQVAAIGVEGLMQTFLPAGSEKAAGGWLPRIVGGFAGAKPALPNLAGKGGPPQMTPGQAQQGQQGQAGDSAAAGGNTTNINVTNQRATEDGTGRDIAFHQQAQNQGPGW